MPNWDTKKGDLELLNKQIEVKGFMSFGPTSFGPTENWDWIYFVDATDFINKKFKVFEIKLSNKSNVWRNIILSGKDFCTDNILDLPSNLEDIDLNELKNLCKQRGIVQGKNRKEILYKLKNKPVGSKLNSPKTFGLIADEDSRGKLRGCFYNIFKPQLEEHCKLIFDDNLSELNF